MLFEKAERKSLRDLFPSQEAWQTYMDESVHAWLAAWEHQPDTEPKLVSKH